MLYVFAGFPKNKLNAGGLQYAIEQVEELGLLEHDPAIQYRKEGVFIGQGSYAEWSHDVEYRFSDHCLQDGIFWNCFPENWSFGNGATIHKTVAYPDYRRTVEGTDLILEEYLTHFGMTQGLKLVRRQIRHESWQKYEARWLPTTCPKEDHVVHLTWLVTDYKLPEFAYQRIRALVEQPAAMDLAGYDKEKHLSIPRIWHGSGGNNALSPIS